MSQKKVEAYKEEKKHRKENLKKAKTRKKITTVLAIIITLLLLAGIGYGVYYFTTREPASSEIDYSEIQKILDEMNAESSVSGNTTASPSAETAE